MDNPEEFQIETTCQGALNDIENSKGIITKKKEQQKLPITRINCDASNDGLGGTRT